MHARVERATNAMYTSETNQWQSTHELKWLNDYSLLWNSCRKYTHITYIVCHLYALHGIFARKQAFQKPNAYFIKKKNKMDNIIRINFDMWHQKAKYRYVPPLCAFIAVHWFPAKKKYEYYLLIWLNAERNSTNATLNEFHSEEEEEEEYQNGNECVGFTVPRKNRTTLLSWENCWKFH